MVTYNLYNNKFHNLICTLLDNEIQKEKIIKYYSIVFI